MKILVVDDKLERRREFKTLLQKHGYQVYVATEGLSALNQLKMRKVQLVLTDTRMPCLSGPELFSEMKIRGFTIPVIGMSKKPGNKKHYSNFWNKTSSTERLLELINKLTRQ